MNVRHFFPFQPTRRAFLATVLAGCAVTPPIAAAETATGRQARAHARQALARVRSWGCQYQNIDVQALAASQLDLVAIDLSLDDYHRRFVTPAQRTMLQRKPDGSRRLVLAYLSVGETDVNRWYWPPKWRERPPEWVGPPNPDWPGSRHVRFWHRRWQALVFRGPDSILDVILDIGFDGIIVDRVDAYLDWEKERPTAEEEMTDLVAAVAAKARKRSPGFILLPQNAEHLLARPRFLKLIDAHNKESLLTGLRGEGVPNAPAEIDWSLNHLRRAQAANVKTLATEYLSDPAAIESARRRLLTLGLVPFFGVRALDRLPTPEES